MKMPGVTKPQREELKTWMTSAFDKYALYHAESNLSAIPRETSQQHQARIQAYGREFGRIILGDLQMDDTPNMLNDLQHLLKAKCPVLDLGELILVCTNDFSMSIDDLLLRVGITKRDLSTLQRTLKQTAQTVEVLIQPALPTPLDYIEQHFPSKHKCQRVRELVETLPDALRYLSVLLNNYPPESDQIVTADEDHFALAWLYLLVNHYGLGYPAVSHLLKGMRCARDASSQAKRSTVPRRPEHTRREVGEERDPFSELAIQQRLSRYWRVVGKQQKLEMSLQVAMYTEFPAYKKLSRRGETLISLLVRLEKDWNANAPRMFARVKAEQRKQIKQNKEKEEDN